MMTTDTAHEPRGPGRPEPGGPEQGGPCRIGYVLKVYPRFSETFIVTEILAREALGDEVAIFALRPTTDARFHPEIARVKAGVSWVPRARRASDMWDNISQVIAAHPDMAARFGQIMPDLARLPGDEVNQGVMLAGMARDAGITHLHAHFASLAGRMTWVASRLSGIPYTLTTHAKDIFHESVDPAWLRRICADAQRVIAISRYNEQYLTHTLAGTGATVVQQYNALELDRFAFTPPQRVHGPLHIAAVGRLVEKKGFHLLVDAVGQLVAAGRDVRLTLAGAGEQEEHLRTRIERLGICGQVDLVGPRTQDEILSLVGGADVMVAPCIPAADGNIDGLPTVVLEAMALGTPVIGTDVTGLPEVLLGAPYARGDNSAPADRPDPAEGQEYGVTGILLPAGDTAALVRALADVADNRFDTATMARNARTLIEERFDSRRQAARLSAWEGGAAAPVAVEEPVGVGV